MASQGMFLDDEELFELTGRKQRRLQIEALKRMLIPFRINAIGRPIVTRTAIVGGSEKTTEATKKWSPTLVA